MGKIISEQKLIKKLNQFRDILLNYDFSEVKNIVFFDVNSLQCYLKTFKNNPFERQYCELDALMNEMLPYLPSALPLDVLQAINDAMGYTDDAFKEQVLMNMKLDFIERVKEINSEHEWQQLVDFCVQLRREKEYELVH